jgi:hypothetical protein
MSDYRIGIVVEGRTDRIVIESALNHIFANQTYTLIQLQPELSDGLSNGGFGSTGSGWGGVYQWCQQIVNMDIALAENRFLQQFDIIIIHLDADVAEKNYQDANINPVKNDLPCVQACSPIIHTIQALEQVVLGWLNLKEQLPYPFVMCIPSKCTEAWVAIALYGESDKNLLVDIECNSNIENYLAQKPAKERLIRNRKGKMKKITQKYSEKSGQITTQWDYITQNCNQAERFTKRVYEKTTNI